MPGILIGLLLTFVLAAGAVAEAKVLGGQSVIVITHDIEIAFTYAQNWPLGLGSGGADDADRGCGGARRPRPARPRPHAGAAMSRPASSTGIALWTGLVLVLIYLPVLCGALASLGQSRYFRFPIQRWSTDWWERTLELARDRRCCLRTSLAIAAVGHAGRRGPGLLRRARLRALRLARPAPLPEAPARCRSSSRSRCWAWHSFCGSARSASSFPGRPRWWPTWSGSCRWWCW